MALDTKEVEEMTAIFFSNLQILGMNIVEKEETHKISFNKDMFKVQNKAGSEVVLHFLFSKLSPSTCKEQFRDCWPVMDRKSELQFRKVCTAWLTAIQKDDEESHLPRVNSSFLLSPGGHKFIHLLYSFSSYVLVQVMKSEYGWEAQNSIVYPVINQRIAMLDTVMSSAIQNSLLRESSKFFQHLHLTVVANRQWKDYSNALVKDYRSLTKSNRDLELEKRQKVNLISDRCVKQDLQLPAKRTIAMFDSEENIFADRLRQRKEKVLSHWVSLTKFSDFMTKKREIFKSILDNSAAKMTINGTDLGVRVPGFLLRECSKEIQKQEIDNIYNGGSLNLVSLVQLWNLCLNIYKEHLKSETLPSVSSEVPLIVEQAQKHQSHLRNTQELREKLRKQTLPNLRWLIIKTQQKLNTTGVSSTSTDKDTNRLGLILTAPTPRTSTNNNCTSIEETPPGPVAGSIDLIQESTPEALQDVHVTIEKAVLKDSQAFHFSKNDHAISRLINNQQRSVSKKAPTGHISISLFKDNLMKTSKTQDSSKSFTVRSKLQPRNDVNNQNCNVTLGQNRQTQKITKKPASKDVTTTPKTSKQIAVDLLADNIVESVFNSTDTTVLSNMSLDTFDFGAEAFKSKNLITRSPTEINQSFQNVENQKTFSAQKSRTYNFHNKATTYNEKLPNSSELYESIFSQSSKDEDSSFGSSIAEFDFSNNAALHDASWLSMLNKSRSDKVNSHKSSTNKSQNMSTDIMPETIPETVDSSLISQLKKYDTNSSEKPRPLLQGLDDHYSTLSGASVNDWQILNRFDAIDDQPYEAHEKDGSEKSNSAHLLPTADLRMVDRLVAEETNDHGSTSKFSKTQQRINLSPSSASQSRLLAEDVSPKTNSMHNKSFGDNIIPYRQPGDGEDTVQSVQQQNVIATGGSDSETEEALSRSRLFNVSPLRPETDSLSIADLLSTPIYSRQHNSQNNVSAHPNVSHSNTSPASPQAPHTNAGKDSDKRLQSQETNLESNSYEKFHILEVSSNELPLDTSRDDCLFENFSKEIEDKKLLDLSSNNIPELVSLDSEEEEEDLQCLNDSYIPFKEGILFESMSPSKQSFTPTKTQLQSLTRTDNPSLSNKTDPVSASQDSFEKKFVMLQQKALQILNSTVPKEKLMSELEQVSMTKTQAMKDSAIIQTNNASVDDLVSL